uniref:Uncharacterized protein n=1 Tax=Arundo donax TaxID=35708 RepID=A0A0A8Z9N4_ARUDO
MPASLFTFNKTMLSLILHPITNYFMRLLSKRGLTSKLFANQQIHPI